MLLRYLCIAAAISTIGGSLMGQSLTAEQSRERMKVAEGFKVEIVAAEPMVRQPVAMEFDDRGRLWVIQYLQYPNPNGLTRVSVDRFSRTKYDRVPEPPPRGPQGADRITILEDTDADGRMDKSHDFVKGLNLATGLAFGHGGVFVLNVPYLLFYPDENRDDIPDADPQVLLNGFGMEDAHSVANSLTFGPDGWLYGCQGSTVTANIRGIEFQQGVWRYHPISREFELFCEGGGNSWGLDFDRSGRLYYSTNYGNYVLLHGVQGGNYIKSFAKHGELHNPHAYGYFDHAPHRNFRGGHVTVGGIIYQGDSFPEVFRDKYIAADLLGHNVYWHSIEPSGSTVKTAHGGELLISNDPWFAPTDVTLGPDGAIYVADWHDQRTAHPDPDAEWDRSNGRIFRIVSQTAKQPDIPDFSKSNLKSLLQLHEHSSQWFVRKARSELVRRYVHKYAQQTDAPEWSQLLAAFREITQTSHKETLAFEALSTLYSIGGFDEGLAHHLLASPHPAVRSWSVRFLGDQRVVGTEMAHRLDEFAEQENDVWVRQQLACSAARLPAEQAMPIINANINRDIDHDDPYLPLLWWWAIEKHSVSGREEVLKRFVRPTLWKSKLGRDFLLPRLIRRYTAERTVQGLDSVVQLLKAAPDQNARLSLWSSIWLGWKEQSPDANQNLWLQTASKHELKSLLNQDWKTFPDNLPLVQLGFVLQHEEIRLKVIESALDPTTPTDLRISMLGILSSNAEPRLVEPLFRLAEHEKEESIQLAALKALSQFDTADLARNLLLLFRMSPSKSIRAQILSQLLSRKSSAALLLAAVDERQIESSLIPIEQARSIALLEDPALDSLVIKHWGKLQATSREEKLAEVRRLNNDLRAGNGSVTAGKSIFQKHCASCHALSGDGCQIGPDLTSANRQDKDYLLISLVDPNSVIRKEYMSVIVRTTSGQVFTGLPKDRSEAALLLINAQGEKQTIANSEIEELRESAISLMPENLYLQLKPAELRDLFAYLQSNP